MVTAPSADPARFIRRYTSISGVIDTLMRKQMPLLNPTFWDDRNDIHFMDLYKKYRKAEGVYALCAARCAETYHHWRVFTGLGAGGACMVIKRAPLEEYLDAVSMPEVTRVRYEEVEYLELPKVSTLGRGDRDRLPFLKRAGFMDEQEYRIVIETNTPQDSAIYIDCPVAWIDRIYLNPWLPTTQAKSLKDAMRELPGCSGVKVRQSYLINSGTWKRAGDKMARSGPLKRIKITVPSKRVAKAATTPSKKT